MTALIVKTHTTCSRSLREPHPVMLCQSAADLSSIHGARHPPAIAFNCGDQLGYAEKSCHIFCKRLAAMLSEKRDSHTAK